MGFVDVCSGGWGVLGGIGYRDRCKYLFGNSGKIYIHHATQLLVKFAGGGLEWLRTKAMLRKR